MARDDATFVIFRHPPAPRETLHIATLSAAAGGAIGAFIATVAVVAFFHGRKLEAVATAAPPPPRPIASVAPLPAAPRAIATIAPSSIPRATGWLSITTSPWSRVYEGDRVLCAATPCARLVLAAGAHDLVLVSSEDQQKRSVRVMVDADETRELRVAFR